MQAVPAPAPKTGIGRFRVFSTDAEKFAQDWAHLPEAPLAWAMDPNVTAQPGVEGGFWVTAPPYRGYAKPLAAGRSNPHLYPVAAVEKIASDLARSIDVPVPPVTLWQRLNAPAGEPQHHAVSAPPFANTMRWGDIAGVPSVYDPLKAMAAEVMSAMVPFDTWVQCEDHVGNPGNLLVTTIAGPPLRAYFAFIDYSYSQVHKWRAASGYQSGFVAPMYDAALTPDIGIMREAIDAVLGVSDGVILKIVGDVPDPYLSPADKGAIIDGLRYRRDNLRKLIGVIHPGVL